jgi:CheY-like chemotaxis protein
VTRQKKKWRRRRRRRRRSLVRTALYAASSRLLLLLPLRRSRAQIVSLCLRSDEPCCLSYRLSNAAKYGDASAAPRVGVCIESHVGASGEKLEDVRSVRVAVTNAAGPDHANLLELGEGELNKIAATQGVRGRPEKLAGISAGEGFPMALASAEAMGGTLRLSLLPTEVVATLTLPRTPIARPAQLDDKVLQRISEQTWAIVDDSKLNCRLLERAAGETFDPGGGRSAVCIAGATLESIENFPAAVVDADADIVFVDQNFGTVCHNLEGTDIVRSIRALDKTSKAIPRLILVVSSNDSPEDRNLYRNAGADGSLSKYMFTKERLLMLIHTLAGAGKVARLNAE